LTARLRERAYLRIAERIVADLLAAREVDEGRFSGANTRAWPESRESQQASPKLRAQRSMPGKLNAVGPTKKTGCSVVGRTFGCPGIPLSLLYPKSFEMRLGPSLIFATLRYRRIARHGCPRTPGIHREGGSL
jgi:hypothetical protein